MRVLMPYRGWLVNSCPSAANAWATASALSHAGCHLRLFCKKPYPFCQSLLHTESYDPRCLYLLRWPFHLFFTASLQRAIYRWFPDVVLLPNLLEARHYLRRKIPPSHYAVLVDQLSWSSASDSVGARRCAEKERTLLEKADLVIVPTDDLGNTLQQPPYNLQIPIEVVPSEQTARLPNNSSARILSRGRQLGALLSRLATGDAVTSGNDA